MNHPRTRRWPLPSRVRTNHAGPARRPVARPGPALTAGLTAALVLAGLAAATGPAAGAEAVAAPDPYAFTSADVGFSEGVRDGLVERLDAMDTYVGDRKPIIRLDLDWWYVQPCRTCPLNWDKLRPVVDAAHTKGIRVLLILDYGVPWANGGKGESGKWFPTEDAAWTGIIDAALAEFGDKIQAYEVWNEPNIVSSGDYGNGTVVERMSRYWQLVQLAHERVHAACPRCVVVAGASANGTAASSAFNENESAAWLEWGLARGYGRFVDAVAHHPYPAWNAGFGPSRPECWTRWWAMFGPPDPKCGELAAVREVMVRHNEGGKKVWATEFGYPSSGTGIRAIPPETVRDHLVEGVRMWRALDYTGPLFIYSYQDRSRDGWVCRENPADAECHFGVTDADGRPKEPMYSGLAAALTGN